MMPKITRAGRFDRLHVSCLSEPLWMSPLVVVSHSGLHGAGSLSHHGILSLYSLAVVGDERWSRRRVTCEEASSRPRFSMCDGHFNEGAHSYIMGCLEPGSWNAVVLAWSGCVDDAATRWRRHSYIHSYIMGWVKVTR